MAIKGEDKKHSDFGFSRQNKLIKGTGGVAGVHNIKRKYAYTAKIKIVCIVKIMI
jgi:hypothetical protein